MTTITINNRNNFSLETLAKLLNSLDIEVLKIESTEIEEVPENHLSSIKKGLKDLDEGKVVPSEKVMSEARALWAG